MLVVMVRTVIYLVQLVVLDSSDSHNSIKFHCFYFKKVHLKIVHFSLLTATTLIQANIF